MKLFFKRTAIIIIIIIAAFFVARTAIISGLVKGILGTGIGRELNLILRQFFGVAGSEEGETLIISVVFITSLILVIIAYRLIAVLISKKSQTPIK